LRVGDTLFGIDTRQIREVLGKTLPQRVPLAPAYIAGIVPYRGEALTTLSLRALLGLAPLQDASCILVLDDHDGSAGSDRNADDGSDRHFGLMVDGVGGVLSMAGDALEPNPSALEPRAMVLFDGAYRMESGLMVRLDPRQLRPSRLAETGLFPSNPRPERHAPLPEKSGDKR
jgi:purine-binding chemotaxis protein CheW